jgi:homoserine kinase
MLVGALASGDVGALRMAFEDRLHQPARLAAAAPSAAAMEAALAAGAWGSWLSGSGPTVAAMCATADADELAAALPPDGHTKVLRIDHEGATIEGPYT